MISVLAEKLLRSPPFSSAMPRSKKQPESPPTQDPSTTLIAACQALTNQLETLTQEVGTLTERTQVLTEAIDDVRCELEWAIRNLHYPPPRLISSAPAVHDHPDEEAIAAAKPLRGKSNEPTPGRQRELWE